MKIADYDQFVRRTDQYRDRPSQERRGIALYGLAGEIGSLFAAVKKKLLSEAGISNWDQPNDEIVEELGDVVWYAFSLAQIANEKRPVNIMKFDIAMLEREIASDDERGKKIRGALDLTSKDVFLVAASAFHAISDVSFDDYQQLAFKTARTRGKQLLEVCLAVLWQLSAELLRKTLPDIELVLNKKLADRPINVVLGEIAWHLSAVASLFSLSMSEVVDRNVGKVRYRSNREHRTELHDQRFEAHEQFPRRLEIAFTTVGRGKSRRYLNGRPLGSDLTDNAYSDDGYRFHDVLHFANIAHLGWSPVFRGLMKRKRKSDSKIDEVEDGARAQIVEEMVVKAIHTEGDRLNREPGRCSTEANVRMFGDRRMITFHFLKQLRNFVSDLEVAKNQYWEWENAIFDGSRIYHELRTHQQGTIYIDVEKRTMDFSPDVCIDLKGVTVGLGVGTCDISQERDNGSARAIATHAAICDALRLEPKECLNLTVKLVDERRACVSAKGFAQERIWSLNAVSYQIAFRDYSDRVECTAVALADVVDIKN
jgi:NTP pyrophosphatase (non-canonical NTP hydrolase)